MRDLTAFHGPNAGYVIELYERYRRDPESVPRSARDLFQSWGASPDVGLPLPPSPPFVSLRVSPSDLAERVRATAALAQGIREYGHLAARIDPLGSDPPGDPELDPRFHGIDEADLAALPAEVVSAPGAEGASNALDAVNYLRRIYCHTTGFDYDHVQSADERAWLRDAAENARFRRPMSAPMKIQLLERLTQVEAFEQFLHRTFPGQKRFSIEGADLLVPMLDEAIRCQTYRGNREVILGMAHRGRLNVLAHVLWKPYSVILSEFERADQRPTAAASETGQTGWSGDVKYHLGARRRGAVIQVSITLAPNPSHLEFVNPVIEGMARAAQDRLDQPGPPSQDLEAALAILIHGDAAFPGEGVVAETLNLSRLAGYQTGGTIHIIVNNQVGFTTLPSDGRSTLYAGDLAKGFEIPIIHVNADDPEACLAAARLACAYRDTFHKDFLIDLVGYRRWGHNEGDEPSFTQPRLYAQIRKHSTVRELWAQKLVGEGIISREEAEELQHAAFAQLDAAHREALAERAPAEVAEAETETPEPAPSAEDPSQTPTAIPLETLRELNDALLELPEEFQLNPRLKRPLDRRRRAIEEGVGIDWAHAETLALAAILADGTPVRFTGQDAERGTFSQRHITLHDMETGETFTPLQALPMARASFAVYNSPLSELAPLGFEYGYSVQTPTTLVIWEAQFGDFINAAQVVVDQFLVSARAKWGQTPGLVLLLPHGYEGQGPEHSSARLERWLQLAAADNLRIVNCTTAGQYFHALRRQVALLQRDPRPLVVMSPKSLLRHPHAAATVEILVSEAFRRVIDDPLVEEARPAPEKGDRKSGRAIESGNNGAATRSELRIERAAVRRLLVCSGKIAIEIDESDLRAEAREVAVVRIEELYPFPEADLERVIASYPNLQEMVWIQEEPANMGAWNYVEPRLRGLLDGRMPLRYTGRPPRPSPAEGSAKRHVNEQRRILQEVLAPLPATGTDERVALRAGR